MSFKKKLKISININKYQLILIGAIIFYFLFSIFGFSQAQAPATATLYFLPSSDSFEVGKTFSVRLAVNTGDNPINLVEANLSFSRDTLEVTGFSKEGTIINLWFNEPTFSNTNGTISFSGGIPNPGFTGIGRLLIINFKAKKAGSAWVKVSSAQVLANDGFGTNVLNSSGSANFTLSEIGLPKPVQTPPKKEQETFMPIKIKVFSSTHPNPVKWYKEKNIILSWDWLPGLLNYSYLLDQESGTIPDNFGEGLSTSTAYLEISEGIWYFHLKAKTAAGWSETSHFKIQIDATPPTDLKISSDQGQITYNPSPTIHFEAKDELSGLDYFTIKINDNEPVTTKENTYQIPEQKPGNYLITVKAYDQAGNYLEENLTLTIKKIPPPKITYWTKELLIAETIGNVIVRGTAEQGTKIKYQMEHETGKKIFAETETKEGIWHLLVSGPLLPGKYYGYAMAAIGEKESSPSSEIEINIVKNGVRFLFWIIPPTMIWGVIVILICSLLAILTLYLGARRKFQKCDVFVKKILARKNNGTKKIKDEEKK